MLLTIKWPPNDPNGKRPVIIAPDRSTDNGRFVAFGRADDQVLGITWSCWMESEKDRPDRREAGKKAVNGFSFFPHGTTGLRRWWAMITVPTAGRYQLTAIGHTKDKKDEQEATAEFQVKFDDGISGDVSIIWPGQTNLEEFRDDFSPYGHLSGVTLANVILSSQDRPGETPIEPLSFYGDGIELEFWTAQFGSLPQGMYTLSVQDSTDHWQHMRDLQF